MPTSASLPSEIPQEDGRVRQDQQDRQEPRLHRMREVAGSFGVDPERYDRSRPSYPQPMIDRILAASPGKDILDVGCGTGIATRQFLAAGCTVHGVDLDERMVESARKSGIEADVSAFEDWDAKGRTFDAVVAGQAWHWVEPRKGAEKALQVLRPGGRLALFWNAQQPPPGLAEAFHEVYARVMPDSPFVRVALARLRDQAREPTDQPPEVRAYARLLEGPAEGIRQTPGLGEPEQWRFEWDRHYTRGAWLDQVPTGGNVANLPPEQLAEILDGIGSAIDAVGGSFTARCTTVVLTSSRITD